MCLHECHCLQITVAICGQRGLARYLSQDCLRSVSSHGSTSSEVSQDSNTGSAPSLREVDAQRWYRKTLSTADCTIWTRHARLRKRRPASRSRNLIGRSIVQSSRGDLAYVLQWRSVAINRRTAPGTPLVSIHLVLGADRFAGLDKRSAPSPSLRLPDLAIPSCQAALFPSWTIQANRQRCSKRMDSANR